ncbi:hypothetical protein H1D32_21040 [Anaerobacillus sp. CMMVII]|nr:hypothetical protein [Anaerobacillus sp. CMMVII]
MKKQQCFRKDPDKNNKKSKEIYWEYRGEKAVLEWIDDNIV